MRSAKWRKQSGPIYSQGVPVDLGQENRCLAVMSIVSCIGIESVVVVLSSLFLIFFAFRLGY